MLIGIFGVAFFFALSGYLITGQIVRETDIGRYYKKRLARIMPLAYVYLAVNAAAALIAGRPMSGYFIHWLFASDWLLAAQYPASIGGVVGHLWTIAVEVQFYMIWPLTLLAAGRFRVAALLMLVVAAFAWRAVMPDPLVASITLPSRIDAFAIGGLIALTRSERWAMPALACGALTLAVSIMALWGTDFSIPQAWGGRSAFLLTGAALTSAGLICLLRDRSPSALSFTPLTWCGERAYSLYIWHVPVLVGAERLSLPFPAQVLAAVVGTTIVSWMSHRFIEIQATNWLLKLGGHSPGKAAAIDPVDGFLPSSEGHQAKAA